MRQTNNIVSILCASYNHEKFISSFINSVLQQTNPNWELIIVDDCSTDNNVREIQKFKDSRIKLIKHPFNMGINCGINTGFAASSGQYIAFCASDDMLAPDYVDNVFRCFKQNPDKSIIYNDLQVIDNNNIPFKNKIIRTANADRYDVLHKMFFDGNCVNSPGMIVKRDLFSTQIPLDIPMSQYQDYKEHVTLLLQSDFMVMDKISFFYRKNDSQSGISAVNEITTRQEHLEEKLLMDAFLKINNIELLQSIFKNDLDEFGKISVETIPFVLGMLAMKSHNKYKKIWGYNQICDFINNVDNYTLVNKMYGFSYKDFLGLAKKFDTAPEKIKYKKYKKLFNILLSVCCVLFFIIIALLLAI